MECCCYSWRKVGACGYGLGCEVKTCAQFLSSDIPLQPLHSATWQLGFGEALPQISSGEHGKSRHGRIGLEEDLGSNTLKLALP